MNLRWSIAARFPNTTFYTKLRPVLRELVDTLFIRDDLAFIGPHGGSRMVKLTSASLDKAMKDRVNRSWYLASSADFPPEVSLKCHRLDEDLSLDITLRGAAWRRYGATLAPTLEALTWSVVESFGARPSFSGGVYLFDVDVPIVKSLTKLRGPFTTSGVVDVRDRRNLESSTDPERAAMLQKIVDAELPTSVRVSERGDVSQRFWTDHLGDEKALRAACKRYQQWLVKTLP